MQNYTRADLADKTATMNQMRNNLYHFIRFLMGRKMNEAEIEQRLRRMGENIAETINNEIDFPMESIDSLIQSIYSEIFDSKITLNRSANLFQIEDKKCPLCKYARENLTISPCEVITSMVSSICSKRGYAVTQDKVVKSVALGDISCIHLYSTEGRGD